MDIIKTDRSNVHYFIGVGVVCLLLWLYILVGVFKEESSPQVLVLCSLIFGIMILIGAWLIWFALLVKNDYIQTDSKGITIDVHSNSLFPKHHQCFYRWEELSSYALDASYKDGKQAHWVYTLELYDVNEQLLEKIEIQSLFNAELIKLNGFIAKHRFGLTLPKPLYDFKRHGETSFCRRKTISFIVMGFISLLAAIVFAAILLFQDSEQTLGDYISFTFLILFFALCGIFFIYKEFVTRKDYITIDQNCITVDMHTTELCRHIRKVIYHDGYQRLSYGDNVLYLYGEDDAVVFSCNCTNLMNSKYLAHFSDILPHPSQDKESCDSYKYSKKSKKTKKRKI